MDDNSQDFYVGPCYFLNAEDGQVLPGSCCLDSTTRSCESDYLPEGTLCGTPDYYNLCSATGKCQGPKGDKGITFFKFLESFFIILFLKGDKGIKGDKGDQGDKGEKGQKGDKGDKAQKGDKGDKGDKAENGDKGNKGDKGNNGENGDKGEKGDKGANGEKGDKGDKNDKGDKGDKGNKGKRGIRGREGHKGEKGEPGEVHIEFERKIDFSSKRILKRSYLFSSHFISSHPSSSLFVKHYRSSSVSFVQRKDLLDFELPHKFSYHCENGQSLIESSSQLEIYSYSLSKTECTSQSLSQFCNSECLKVDECYSVELLPLQAKQLEKCGDSCSRKLDSFFLNETSFYIRYFPSQIGSDLIQDSLTLIETEYFCEKKDEEKLKKKLEFLESQEKQQKQENLELEAKERQQEEKIHQQKQQINKIEEKEQLQEEKNSLLEEKLRKIESMLSKLLGRKEE